MGYISIDELKNKSPVLDSFITAITALSNFKKRTEYHILFTKSDRILIFDNSNHWEKYIIIRTGDDIKFEKDPVKSQLVIDKPTKFNKFIINSDSSITLLIYYSKPHIDDSIKLFHADLLKQADAKQADAKQADAKQADAKQADDLVHQFNSLKDDMKDINKLLIIENINTYMFIHKKDSWYKISFREDDVYPNIKSARKIRITDLIQLHEINEKLKLKPSIEIEFGNFKFDYSHYIAKNKIIIAAYFEPIDDKSPPDTKPIIGGGSYYRKQNNIIKKNLLYNNRRRIDQIKESLS